MSKMLMWVSALSPIVLGVVLLTILVVPANDVVQVRPAAVAGTFYPADPSELEKTVDGLLAGAQVAPVQGQLWAIISPHAGYPYSGAVAAHAYALVKGQRFRRVVVIAPSHYESPGARGFHRTARRRNLKKHGLGVIAYAFLHWRSDDPIRLVIAA